MRLKGDEVFYVYEKSLGILRNSGFLKLQRFMGLSITKSKLFSLSFYPKFFYKRKLLKNTNKIFYTSFTNKKVFQNLFISKYGIVKKLKFSGIGFKIYMKRDFLVLKSSLNHLIFLKIPEKILVKILKGKVIFLYGFQKVELDNFENIIYSCFIPDSYKRKGIHRDFLIYDVRKPNIR